MYTSVNFTSREGGPLSHKQGGRIHQFGVWLGRDLKNKFYNVKIFIIYV
jgi:hypothetical protein